MEEEINRKTLEDFGHLVKCINQTMYGRNYKYIPTDEISEPLNGSNELAGFIRLARQHQFLKVTKLHSLHSSAGQSV